MTDEGRGHFLELPGGGTIRVRSVPGFLAGVVVGTTQKQADAVRAYAERLAGFTGEDVDAVEAEAWKLLFISGRVSAITNLGDPAPSSSD